MNERQIWLFRFYIAFSASQIGWLIVVYVRLIRYFHLITPTNMLLFYSIHRAHPQCVYQSSNDFMVLFVFSTERFDARNWIIVLNYDYKVFPLSLSFAALSHSPQPLPSTENAFARLQFVSFFFSSSFVAPFHWP